MSHITPAPDPVVATPATPADRLRLVAQEIREGGLNALVAIVKRNQVLSLAGASTLLLFIAGLGPQISATDHIEAFSYNVATVQTHPIVPGWVYLLFALGAAVGLVQFARTTILEWLMVTRLAAGLSVLAVVIAFLQSAFDSSIGLGGEGWGYYLAFVATFVLAFVIRVLYSRTKRAARLA